MSLFLDVLKETALDALKMLPVLYLSYLLMEFLEQRAGEKMNRAIARVGKAGPLIGGLLGIIPQCGFSGAVAGFYAGGIASLGTMMAVFLSTSDEMLPLLLSKRVPAPLVLKILVLKASLGIVLGYVTDLLFRRDLKGHIDTLCEQDHCECEGHSVFRSAAVHTLKVMTAILAVTLILNLLLEIKGSAFFRQILTGRPFISTLLSGLIGLIPSCSVSVLLTELYLEQLLPASAFMAGLFANAGVGLLVLFRQHRSLKKNLLIVLLLYGLSLAAGEISGLFF